MDYVFCGVKPFFKNILVIDIIIIIYNLNNRQYYDFEKIIGLISYHKFKDFYTLILMLYTY